MSDIVEILKTLSEAPGISGHEHEVRNVMKDILTPHVDRVTTDGLGSLIAHIKKDDDLPNVMLSAHMDEVGLMVRYITSDGFIKFQTIGGWLDQAIVGQRWVISTSSGKVNGISGIKTPHVMSAEERNRVFKKENLFLDVGALDKEDAMTRLGIRPGDPISPISKFERLNQSDFLLGKAWDDRAGLAVMSGVIEALNGIDLPCNIYAVATVQEEVGLRGAQTSSDIVAPDIGINLESGVASDYPGISEFEAQESLGKGPAIFLHDSSMLPNHNLRDLVEETAANLDMKLQYNVLSGYGQDGAEMQRSKGGAPSINITVPTRYLHSHNSIIHLNDVNKAIKLVSEVVKKLDLETVSNIRSFE